MIIFWVLRFVRRLFVILICLGIFFSLIYPFILGNTSPGINPSLSDKEASNLVIGLKISEFPQNVQSSNDFSAEQRELINKFEVPLVVISLDYIYVPPGKVFQNDKLCIQEISISGEAFSLEDFGIFDDRQPLLEDANKQACFHSGVNFVVLETAAFRPMLLENNRINDFYYPFDNRQVSLDVLLKGYIIREDGRIDGFDGYDVKVSLFPSQWEGKVIINQKTSSVGASNDYMVKDLLISLKRIWFHRLLYFIIPIIATAALVGLLAVENPDSFWQVSIAMLGLWSIRQILIPDYIKSPTIMDQILTLLYILLLLVLFAYFVTKLKKRGIVDLTKQIPVRMGSTNLIRWGEDQINKGSATKKELYKSFLARAETEVSVSVKRKFKTVAEFFDK